MKQVSSVLLIDYTDAGGCSNRAVQFREVLWLCPLSEDLFSVRVHF